MKMVSRKVAFLIAFALLLGCSRAPSPNNVIVQKIHFQDNMNSIFGFIKNNSNKPVRGYLEVRCFTPDSIPLESFRTPFPYNGQAIWPGELGIVMTKAEFEYDEGAWVEAVVTSILD
jgi:hypothetical protein